MDYTERKRRLNEIGLRFGALCRSPFKDHNFMTPDIIGSFKNQETGVLGLVVEISMGNFTGKDIYGLTFRGTCAPQDVCLHSIDDIERLLGGRKP